MKEKKYLLLRRLLREAGIDNKRLAILMNRSVHYVVDRFSGRYPWSLDDQYFLMDLLVRPYSELHLVFPKEGVAIPPEQGEGHREDPGLGALVTLAKAILAYAEAGKK